MEYNYPKFTPEMKKTHTILIPNMAITQFRLLEYALRYDGYKCEILGNCGSAVAQLGLKYVHNDTCYPALLVIGQFLDALNSGKYDLEHTALLITQTGGGCRATNYIGFIRRALKKAGMEQIPVISINLSGLESNPGFKITPTLATRLVYGAVFGDILMKCTYRMRPYEIGPGSTNALHKKWKKRCIRFVSQKHCKYRDFQRICRTMIRDFDHIPITDEKKPRVGIVGEILVKFLPAANNYLAELLESEGAEAVVPDLIDFMSYCFYNQNFKVSHLGMKKSKATIGNLGIAAIEWFRAPATKAFEKSKHFAPPSDIRNLGKIAYEIVSLGNQTGEGWFLTGEMLELIHSGAPNIVCTQPFACLPNHVVGRGITKKLKEIYPDVQILPLDYDPDVSFANIEKRLQMLVMNAKQAKRRVSVVQKKENKKETVKKGKIHKQESYC